MSNYNPKSMIAEEFISHEEILETIKYAEENKHNTELIDALNAADQSEKLKAENN